MTEQIEQVAFAEAEHPAYLDHWTQFADEQIMMENSPIREDERVRFRAHCAENASRLADARGTMLAEPTAHNVHEWYARLGSTADLESAKPDMVVALSSLLKSPEANVRDDKTMLLAGNIAQELGEITEGQDAAGYYALAGKIYGAFMKEHKGDVNIPSVRQAAVHLFDTNFAALSKARRDGLIDQATFDKQYESRHKEFVRFCGALTDKDSNIGNGELYEFYGEMMLRHRLWATERFGEIEVRRSFEAREDKPHDRLNLKQHRDLPAHMKLPTYSFDLHLSVLDGSESPRRLQMKTDDADNHRYGKPTITVMKYSLDTPLREHMRRMTDIMQRSYRFDATAKQEAELAAAAEDFAVAA